MFKVIKGFELDDFTVGDRKRLWYTEKSCIILNLYFFIKKINALIVCRLFSFASLSFVTGNDLFRCGQLC